MPDANSTFIAQAPVPPTSGNWNEIKPISADLQTDDPEYLNADYIAYQTSTWVPEMPVGIRLMTKKASPHARNNGSQVITLMILTITLMRCP